MKHLSLLLFVAYFGFTEGNEEPAGTQCLSRFDYDFKMMEKIINLETQFQEIKKSFNEYFGLNPRRMSKGCPNGWIAYEGSCYLFATNKLQFTAAEDYCRHLGGRLVHVETYEENIFLKGFMKDHSSGGEFWLGMTEITDGVWTWYGTDKHVQYTNWLSGEPNNFGGPENCAVFSYKYEWADIKCLESRKALCEI